MENEKTNENIQEQEQENNIVQTLASMGWGLFLIWIGIAWFLNLGTAIALLGAGAITFAIQGVRKYLGLDLEKGWLFVGTIFILSGIWEIFAITFELVPLLMIIAGLVVIVSIIQGKMKRK